MVNFSWSWHWLYIRDALYSRLRAIHSIKWPQTSSNYLTGVFFLHSDPVQNPKMCWSKMRDPEACLVSLFLFFCFRQFGVRVLLGRVDSPSRMHDSKMQFKWGREAGGRETRWRHMERRIETFRNHFVVQLAAGSNTYLRSPLSRKCKDPFKSRGGAAGGGSK